MQRGFTYELDDVDGIVQLRVSGELDLHSVQALVPVLDDIEGGGRSVILDGSELTFMDSTALGELHRRFRTGSEHVGRSALVITHPSVIKVLEITGLRQTLPVFGDLQAARTHVRITDEVR